MKDSQDDDPISDDAIVGSIVSDAQTVERRDKAGKSFDSCFDFLEWFRCQASLDLKEDRFLDISR